MTKSVTLGIDIGGTNTVYGFVGENGHVHQHKEIPTHGSKPVLDLVDRIKNRVQSYLTDNTATVLSGIGIGAPNGNHFTGRIQDPPNLSWGNVDIVALFKERFDCDVILTNDANAAALGEKHYGAAKEMDDFIVITLGTGLGSGIFSGGRL